MIVLGSDFLIYIHLYSEYYQAFNNNLFTSICYIFRLIVERSYVLTIDSFFSDLAIVMNLTAASFSLEMSSTGQLPLCFIKIFGIYILSSESVK